MSTTATLKPGNQLWGIYYTDREYARVIGDHVAARAKVVNIEQVTRIQTVAAQLEKWRDDLMQQRRQCVSHHV